MDTIYDILFWWFKKIMTKLINFDLNNWVLDCYSDSIKAFTDFIRKNLENDIEKVNDFNINKTSQENLENISKQIKHDEYIKKYFDVYKKENFFKIKSNNSLLFIFKDIIDEKYFNWLYFNDVVLNINMFNINEINNLNYDWCIILPKWEVKFVIHGHVFVIESDKKTFHIPCEYENHKDYKDVTFQWYLNILNKEIQKQIIESEEYAEYLKLFNELLTE